MRLAILLLLLATVAEAHDLRPGVLAFVETSPGELRVRFVPPIDNRGQAVDIVLVLPAGCTRDGERVHCTHGFGGELAVTGMRGHAMKIAVSLDRGGTRSDWVLTTDTPRIVLGAAPPSTAFAWLRTGIEHILGGLDHLAFVIGLLLVLELSLSKRMLWTITAFTLAHSLSLALAVLGVVHAPIGPVEACIAASVLLVAREATHHEPTAVRRWPWIAAALFGLVHGLGFASALGSLPAASLAWSLVWFNLGVELGQLAVIAVVVGAVVIARRLVREGSVVGVRAHRAACYALGTLAAWWLLARLADLAR